MIPKITEKQIWIANHPPDNWLKEYNKNLKK
jgi:hypothetical protein